ncbi:MAG: transcription antitermination factor NusB [Actinomycetota bacterium]|jgi:N utilization substance protein B|nr:transcription antitermination factor NusB [Actinomycetota bacterium]
MSAAEGTRRQGRERALSILYEAELKGVPPADVLAGLPVPPDQFVCSLVVRSENVRARAHDLISDAAIGWPLDRMAVIDRLVLRLAVGELLDPDGPPPAVVIDEAVELAKTYSTEESGGFVNGVLSAIQRSIAVPGQPGDVPLIPADRPPCAHDVPHPAGDC